MGITKLGLFCLFVGCGLGVHSLAARLFLGDDSDRSGFAADWTVFWATTGLKAALACVVAGIVITLIGIPL